MSSELAYDSRVTSRDDLAREAWGGLTQLFLGDAMHDRFVEAVQASGLPHPGALRALLSLSAGDPPPMRALAERLRCDASYVTGLIDSLEDAGLVERRVSATDRRVKLVHVTAAGRRALAKAQQVITTPYPGLKRLTEAELRTLARLVQKFAD